MINKRLVGLVPDAKKHVARSVALQWCGLVCNMVFMGGIALAMGALITQSASPALLCVVAGVSALCIALRLLCTYFAARQSYLASRGVKQILREKIYTKLLQLGSGYTKTISTAELVQLSGEGVEQLESYFGSYLPQFFYAMLAPVTLFCVLGFVNLRVALALLLCVPLIPISIIAVQKFAKKLLGKYWGEYTALGDHFLENLQGLNTLKIYGADAAKHKQMNAQAERFRVVTMKVLTMQLNSIIIMDIIAYGGAGLGIVLSIAQTAQGNMSVTGCILLILLSAEFFLPLRLLGSFFHLAMNGMAASKKIFKLLDTPVLPAPTGEITGSTVVAEGLSYRYLEKDTDALHNLSFAIPPRSFVAIVGKSGCGKSTLAGVLAGVNQGYGGCLTIGDMPLSQASPRSIAKTVGMLGLQSYLFKGTVRENLQMGNFAASDAMLWDALAKVNLEGFFRAEDGLDTIVKEGGRNFSGGQCQRLALARALLKDADIYIFDEATSNIDVESENQIMSLLHTLTQTKTVILISHRLANVVQADAIYLLEQGELCAVGSHETLLAISAAYQDLWQTQQALEAYTGGAPTAPSAQDASFAQQAAPTPESEVQA